MKHADEDGTDDVITVPVNKVQKSIGSLTDEVHFRNQKVVITKYGKPFVQITALDESDADSLELSEPTTKKGE